jgi:hypothetical protein
MREALRYGRRLQNVNAGGVLMDEARLQVVNLAFRLVRYA